MCARAWTPAGRRAPKGRFWTLVRAAAADEPAPEEKETFALVSHRASKGELWRGVWLAGAAAAAGSGGEQARRMLCSLFVVQ